MSTPERQIKEIIYITVKNLLFYAKEHGLEKHELEYELDQCVKLVFMGKNEYEG